MRDGPREAQKWARVRVRRGSESDREPTAEPEPVSQLTARRAGMTGMCVVAAEAPDSTHFREIRVQL